MALPGIRIVGLVVREDRPEHAGVFVGDRDQRLVIADAIVGGDHPGLQSTAPIRVAQHRRAQRRSCALRQQAAQVRIAASRNSSEPLLAAGAPLARHEPQPGGEVRAVAEVAGIGNGGHERARRDGTDTADRVAPTRSAGRVRGSRHRWRAAAHRAARSGHGSAAAPAAHEPATARPRSGPARLAAAAQCRVRARCRTPTTHHAFD